MSSMEDMVYVLVINEGGTEVQRRPFIFANQDDAENYAKARTRGTDYVWSLSAQRLLRRFDDADR